MPGIASQVTIEPQAAPVPHLSRADPKPMDVFGGNWEGHPEIFFERWRETVSEEDLVLVPGDISWAMRLEDALLDFAGLCVEAFSELGPYVYSVRTDRWHYISNPKKLSSPRTRPSSTASSNATGTVAELMLP